MNKFITLLSVSVAGSALFLFGCSKNSRNGANNSSNSNSPGTSTAGGGSATAAPTDLKIKWQTGKRYDMRVDVNQSTEIKTSGQPIHQDLNLTQNIHYSPLKDLDNGGNQVELEFDSQKIDFSQNGKQILNYDSAQKTPIDPNTPAAPVAAAMGAMLGVPLDYTFAADGTLEKIDGVDALTNRINDALPNQRQRMTLQQLYDDDTLKQYGAFSEALAGHPVSIGDSWSSSHDINNPAGVLTVDTTYTFKDRVQHGGYNCVHLVMNGDIKTKTASAATIGAVVKIQNGTLNGEAWLDPDLGMFVDFKTDQDLTLNITTRTEAIDEHMKENVETSLVSVSP